MSIKEQIEDRLKQARRDRDEATKNVIGMLKSKMLNELKSGSGREENDALWLETITTYAKGLRKAMAEFEKAGERSADAKQEAEFELAFCESFLPKKLNEADTEALVRKIAEAQGIASAKQIGKLMGVIMKEHRDEVDGDLARSIAQRILAD